MNYEAISLSHWEIVTTLLLLLALYHWFEAKEDKNNLGHINHQVNWLGRATVGVIIAFAMYQFRLKTISFSLVLMAYSWITIDIALALKLGQNPLTYIGSGYWDEVFKQRFSNPRVALWIAKGTLLVITVILHLLL